jgi:hypothetical protein
LYGRLRVSERRTTGESKSRDFNAGGVNTPDMSADESESRLETVTPLSAEHLDREMGAIGYGIAALLALVLLPLLPIVAVLWLLARLLR